MQSVLLKPESMDTTPILLHLHLEATLNVRGKEACSVVPRQVVPLLGTGLIDTQPAWLSVTEAAITWRVPVSLSLPCLGDLGQVGSVCVDARTGDVQLEDEERERLVRHARHLYRGATLL